MIYLDNAATSTPLKESVEFAQKYIENYYNPSALYSGGIEVSSFLKEVRAYIVSTVCHDGYDCIFTSCGTEADNTAVFSSAKRGNAVTTLGEHSAVFEPFKELERRGVEARFAKLNKDGSVNTDDLLSKIDGNTSFVSVVHVNNETGAVNDINAIAEKVKKINPKTVFHSDGVQAYGKMPYRLSSAVDMYSISAHKIGALKGVGALLKKKNISLHPLIFGGGQEGGLRSGTENVFGIATFYKAAQVRYSQIAADRDRYIDLKNLFVSTLNDEYVKLISSENCAPHIVSITAPKLRGEVLQHILEKRGIIVGTGSACASLNKHSRVLKECGYSAQELDGVLRISFSAFTRPEDVVEAANGINDACRELKKVIV